ncbi:MAG TPA: TMEM175 family protein [Candidatus Sulfotelmatobacter sp.]|nr:TMEM175 family protein [Candidatus Sulfotelmatobacter sp.]
MEKGRLEAFSDGVVAILITIMVLSLVAPHGADLAALMPLGQVFLSYVLSFVNLAIYWNNHHHLLQAATAVDGRVLWANMHLLFWLSLLPFVTSWMGANGFAAIPTALYGLVLLLAAVAYTILVRALISVRGQGPAIAAAIGDDRKGLLSLAAYAVGTPIALVAPWVALALYVAVAVIWFVPDRRMERVLATRGEAPAPRDKES